MSFGSALQIGHIAARLTVDNSDWSRGLQSARGDLRGFNQDVQQTGRNWQQVGEQMTGLGRRMTIGVTTPILAVGTGMLKAAGDAEAASTRMSVTFGATMDAMNADLRELQQIAPASFTELQNAASGAMGALVTLGIEQGAANDMTREALEVSNALAAHMDISLNEALQRVTAGYAGNTQGLRDMAFAINQADINQKALELGLIAQGESADGAARAMAVHNIVLEQMDGFMHAAEERAGTFNFQLRQLWGSVQDTAAAFGEHLLPLAVQFVGWADTAITAFGNLDSSIQMAILGIGGLTAAIGPLLIAIGGIASLAPAIGTGLAFLLPAAPYIAGALALAGGVGLVASRWDELKEKFPSTTAGLRDVSGASDDTADSFRDLGDAASEAAAKKGELDDAYSTTDQLNRFNEWMADTERSIAGEMIPALDALLTTILSVGEAGIVTFQEMFAVEPDLGRWWSKVDAALSRPGQAVMDALDQSTFNPYDYAELSRPTIPSAGEGFTEFDHGISGMPGKLDEAALAAQQLANDIDRLNDSLSSLSDEQSVVQDSIEILRSEIERTGDPTGMLTERLGRLVIAEGQLAEESRQAALDLALLTAEGYESAGGHEAMAQAILATMDVMGDQTEQVTNLGRQYEALHGQIGIASERMGHWSGLASDAEQALEFLTEEIERTGDETGELAQKKADLEWWLGRTEGGVRDETWAFVDGQIELAEYTRLHDELRSAYENGDISRDDYETGLRELNNQFDMMTADGLTGALEEAGGLVDTLIDGLRDLMIDLGILDETEVEATLSVDNSLALQHIGEAETEFGLTRGVMETPILLDADETDAVAGIHQAETEFGFTRGIVETPMNLDADGSAAEREISRIRGLVTAPGIMPITVQYRGSTGADSSLGFTQRATGGTVQPGEITMTGERGRELAIFPPGTEIIPNLQTEQIMQALERPQMPNIGSFTGGGNTSTNTIEVNIANGAVQVTGANDSGVVAHIERAFDRFVDDLTQVGMGAEPGAPRTVPGAV